MSILHRALGLAVQRIVGDPRVRAKAVEVVERELKPRIKEAVERARPRLQAARDEIREIAKETDPWVVGPGKRLRVLESDVVSILAEWPQGAPKRFR